MKYYAITPDGLFIAENKQALTRFYDNVQELPEDYIEGKYIVKDGELVLNPDWEEEEAQRIKDERIAEIKRELEELDLKTIRPLRAGETDRLEELEQQAQELREELQRLSL